MIKILSKGGDALREGCLVTDAGKCRTVAFRSGLSWFFFQASSFPHFLVPDCEAKRDFIGVEQVACYSSLPPPRVVLAKSQSRRIRRGAVNTPVVMVVVGIEECVMASRSAIVKHPAKLRAGKSLDCWDFVRVYN